jgi:hypothetical protein
MAFVSQVPFADITDAALNSWKQDRFADTEASLTAIIINSGHASHHALANRALVRAHLRHWDAAIDGAKNVSPALLFLPTTYACSQVHQYSAIRHWLHCEECSTHRRRKKGGGLFGVRLRLQALS